MRGTRQHDAEMVQPKRMPGGISVRLTGRALPVLAQDALDPIVEDAQLEAALAEQVANARAIMGADPGAWGALLARATATPSTDAALVQSNSIAFIRTVLHAWCVPWELLM